MRTTYLPESEAGQDGALRATTSQKHSPSVGSQAPVTDPASLTEALSLKDKGKKTERPFSFTFSIIHLCEKFGRENREERESACQCSFLAIQVY
ncbi:hypothetical protein BRARA_B02301 [Brassica rapa]|uniref:Uncharacterized protein n=1 Tax=Brassica campestris TaxID=3711 RepID=A0A398ABV3_BRACM|nr:hypothetical protein BRARA_B02301 [Brassica rapa]